MPIVYALLGLVILVLSGDSLVRGAVDLSRRLGIPALVVSLTIVAIGTSAPELLVSISAVLEHAPGIAVGNVVGSNTANVLLVLGLPALLVGLDSTECDTKTSYVQMLVGTVLFIAILLVAPILWWHGIALVGLYFLFMAQAVRSIGSRRNRNKSGNQDALLDGSSQGWLKIGAYLAIGVIGLPLGADLLVTNATIIASNLGVSETVIGLTLVAIGTSLPELATTVSAAFRRQADVALGNVIGSNMANLLGVIGVASFFGPIPVSEAIIGFDIWVMVAASLLLIPFVYFRMIINRIWGAGFVAMYIIYVGMVLT